MGVVVTANSLVNVKHDCRAIIPGFEWVGKNCKLPEHEGNTIITPSPAGTPGTPGPGSNDGDGDGEGKGNHGHHNGGGNSGEGKGNK